MHGGIQRVRMRRSSTSSQGHKMAKVCLIIDYEVTSRSHPVTRRQRESFLCVRSNRLGRRLYWRGDRVGALSTCTLSSSARIYYALLGPERGLYPYGLFSLHRKWPNEHYLCRVCVCVCVYLLCPMGPQSMNLETLVCGKDNAIKSQFQAPVASYSHGYTGPTVY